MILGFVLATLITGADLIGGDLDGRKIEVEGRAIGFTESGFAMKVDDIPMTVIVEQYPAFLQGCSIIQPKVRVTGVLEQVYGATAGGQIDGVVGIRLHLDQSNDIVFVPDMRFVFNPFTLGIILAILVGYLAYISRRQLKTRTLIAERRRMADDLHDTIEQHLVGAGMLLQLGRTDAAREILIRAKKEMRDIVWGLKNDDMMRLTPTEMIREYAKSETKKGVCRVETRMVGLPDHLNASQMRDLSLVIREAVGNAVKHGGAHKIAIVADSLPKGGWKLRISNDGSPYDSAKAPGPNEGHFGLEGMNARARRLGADFSIAVEAGRTVVSITRNVI